jgi:hypothetical protein
MCVSTRSAGSRSRRRCYVLLSRNHWRFLALFGAFREVFVTDRQRPQKVKACRRSDRYNRVLGPYWASPDHVSACAIRTSCVVTFMLFNLIFPAPRAECLALGDRDGEQLLRTSRGVFKRSHPSVHDGRFPSRLRIAPRAILSPVPRLAGTPAKGKERKYLTGTDWPNASANQPSSSFRPSAIWPGRSVSFGPSLNDEPADNHEN